MIATKQADNSYTYAFADEQGAYTGNVDAGDYFPWNTLELTGGNYGSWDDTQDPCRQIGDKLWYTPTATQLEELVAAGNVWGTWKKSGGTTVNGRYFGTTNAPDESKQNSIVFLPAAGYEAYNFPFSNVNITGSYWSSTDAAGAMAEARALYFNENNLKITYGDGWSEGGGYIYAERTDQKSIRCVRDK